MSTDDEAEVFAAAAIACAAGAAPGTVVVTVHPADAAGADAAWRLVVDAGVLSFSPLMLDQHAAWRPGDGSCAALVTLERANWRLLSAARVSHPTPGLRLTLGDANEDVPIAGCEWVAWRRPSAHPPC